MFLMVARSLAGKGDLNGALLHNENMFLHWLGNKTAVSCLVVTAFQTVASLGCGQPVKLRGEHALGCSHCLTV